MTNIADRCGGMMEENTQIYMAPMEGITGYVYRRTYFKHFNQIDTYFTPFIASTGLSTKEKKDVLPEHNEGMHVVPQILANQTDVFIEIAEKMKAYGYDEVNLNLGCPSGTVSSRGRGAGFLGYPEKLEAFLDEIFDKCPLKISVKTRIGTVSEEAWPALLALYEKYPMTELIIHPRTLKDFYKNTPKRECFGQALAESRHSLCYNGDLNRKEDYEQLLTDYPQTKKVMLGRGLLANPGLAGELRGETPITKDKLEAFLTDLLHGYREELSGDTPVLYKMKELWFYLGKQFEQPEKYLKQIKKANTLQEYSQIVRTIFRNCELL